MLGAGAQAADHQKYQERNETSRGCQRRINDGGEKRSGGQDAWLAPTVRQIPRRDLEQASAPSIRCAAGDLREGEREFARHTGRERTGGRSIRRCRKWRRQLAASVARARCGIMSAILSIAFQTVKPGTGEAASPRDALMTRTDRKPRETRILERGGGETVGFE